MTSRLVSRRLNPGKRTATGSETSCQSPDQAVVSEGSWWAGESHDISFFEVFLLKSATLSACGCRAKPMRHKEDCLLMYNTPAAKPCCVT